MKRTLLKSVGAVILATFIWNLIIGTFLFRLPKVNQSTDMGKTYSPNKTIVFGEEGYFRDQMDQFGFNNDAQVGENGIIVIGDSHTEAFQLPRKDNYISLLDKQLKGSDYTKNVVNLGMSGNSVGEYIYYAEDYLNEFNPDQVVIQVTYYDFYEDVINTSKNISVQKIDGQYQVVHSNQNTSKIKMYKDIFVGLSPVTGYTYTQLKKLAELNREEASIATTDEDKDINIEELIRFQAEKLYGCYGDKLVILYLPFSPFIVNGEVRLDYIEEEKKIKEQVDQCFDALNVKVIDVTKEFKELYINEASFPRGFNNTKVSDGHLNAKGHEIVANELYQYFLKELIEE